jgi:hypothetical protein
MTTTNLIEMIASEEASRQERIEAIKELGVIRSHEKEQLRAGATHLGELSGQRTLQRVVQRRREELDVRCQAAAVTAKTDSKSVLEWCNQIIRRHC